MGEATRRGRRTICAAGLAMLLAGCGGGGSGSTGLITSEGGVVDGVRETGTCEEFEGTPYCGTDSPNAVAPGGQSVSIVGTAVPTPQRTASPAPAGTASPAPDPTGTPAAGEPTAAAATPTPRIATPRPTASPSDAETVRALVEGFEAGAACATAARAAGSADPWQTAALVGLPFPAAVAVFPLPDDAPVPFDLALLCFAEPPTSVSTGIPTLAAAAPTVIFVLPSP